MQNSGDRGTLSGALSIVSGVLGILSGVALVVFGFIFLKIVSDPSFAPGIEGLPPTFFSAALALYSSIGFVVTLIGILGIVGGIFAVRRKHWSWALAGAIAGSLTFYPCGIAAVIFVCLGKSEFDDVKPPSPPQIREGL